MGKSSHTRRVLTQNELLALHAVATPIWVFSCATNKVLWANNSAQQFFKLSLDQLMSFRLSRTSVEDPHSLASLTARVRDEVELGGSDITFLSDGSPLPGVVPNIDCAGIEFLYQQLMLAQPDSDTTLCTLVQISQVLRGSAQQDNHAVRQSLVKTYKRIGSSSENSSDKRTMQMAGPLSMSAIFDLVENILVGKPVVMESVEALHSMLIRGELIAQPSRMGEELVVKEELDQDVGLNLLQLLGSHSMREGIDLVDAVRDELGSGPGNSPVGLMPTIRGDSSSLSMAELGHARGSVDAAPDDDDPTCCLPIASVVPAMEAVLATVDEWRFDAFKLGETTYGHPMSALGFFLIKRAGLLESLQLDAQALARFLRKVEDGYPDNPYHNKTHAADVLQSMHVLMTRGGLLRRLGDDSQLLMLAGYIAAIVHDNEHRGLNNDYLVRVSDELAITYNDSSPMENHHVAAAFRVLRTAGYNFMRKLSRDRMTRLRRMLIDMVLATDMKQHFAILNKFQAKLQVKLRSSGYQSSPHASISQCEASLNSGSRNSDDAVVVDEEVDRSLVMQVALKVADVGHLAAPWELHHRWVSGLEEEFFRQGDKEKAAHLMVSPLMDRCKDGITKSQVGFFDIVALPLFYSWAAVFHESLPLVRAVEDNCNRWRALEVGRNSHVSR